MSKILLMALKETPIQLFGAMMLRLAVLSLTLFTVRTYLLLVDKGEARDSLMTEFAYTAFVICTWFVVPKRVRVQSARLVAEARLTFSSNATLIRPAFVSLTVAESSKGPKVSGTTVRTALLLVTLPSRLLTVT